MAKNIKALCISINTYNLPDHPKLRHSEWRMVVQDVENPIVAALNSWLQTKKKYILFLLAIFSMHN